MKKIFILIGILTFGSFLHGQGIQNWFFDFHSSPTKSEGEVKDPEENVIGSYIQHATGSYEAGNKFEILVRVEQNGKNGSSTYESRETWSRNPDGTYTATYEKENKESTLTLRGDRIFTISTSIDGKPWTTEIGVLAKGSLVYSGVIYVSNLKDSEFPYITYSGTTRKTND